MDRRLAQASLFVVAIIIGILLVGQLRSQARPLALSSLTPQELSTLIETVSARNSELRDGLADLREQIVLYEDGEMRGQSNLQLAEEDLARIRAFGGLSGVEGQGIVMQMEGSFDPTAVNDLIQELRNAGAEAIAVDGIRITARSVAVLGTRAIEIDGRPIGRSFELSAIGSPAGLDAAMTRPGGILSLLRQSVEAEGIPDQRRNLTVPATLRDLAPQVARPVE